MILRLPNGKVVEVPQGTSPAVIARLKAENPAAGSARPNAGSPKPNAVHTPAPLSAHQQEVNRRVSVQSRAEPLMRQLRGSNPLMDPSLAKGALMGFTDELTGALDAGTRGVFNAIKHRDLSRIPQEYRVSRDTERQLQRNREEAEPIKSTVAEVMGAIVNPIGPGGKALTLAGKGAARFAPRIAQALTRGGSKIAAAPIPIQAALAGANQGFAHGMGAAENNTLESGLTGAVLGAGFGGALGTATHLGVRGAQIYGDSRPVNAARTAYSHIANLLTSAKTTPERVALQLNRAERGGNDAMVMDMSPGLRAEASAVSRRPSVPRSNEMIERGEQRIRARPGNFETQVREGLNPPRGPDADIRISEITGARKAAGQRDYSPEMMDRNFVWNDDLERFFTKPNPHVKRALKQAEQTVLGDDLNPTQLGFKFNAAGDIEYIRVPNMRVFDYIKRGFDAEIGTAVRAGDRNTARILSGQLDQLKAGIAKSNPDYAPTLARQRDFFQQQEAVEIGQKVVSRLRSEPRKVLKDLRALDPSKIEDARTGIADAIIGLRTQKQNPVAFLHAIMESPEQRRVMEFAFGGRIKLIKFERWMRNELRAAKADNLTAPGRQSETSRIEMAAADSGANDFSALATDVGRGYGFGGNVGAVGNLLRGLGRLKSGKSAAVQDEIARILMSKGRDLPKGVQSTRAFLEARKIKNRKRAIRFAKGGQQLVTGYAGQEE